MKKTISAILLSSLAFAGGNASFESTTRLESLGLSNTQIEDISNIWMNPAFLSMYKNRGYVEESGLFGVSYETTVGTFGLFYSRNGINNIPKSAFFTVDPVSTYGAPLVDPVAAKNQVDVLYSKTLNKDFILGIRASYAANNESSLETQSAAASGTAYMITKDFEFEVGAILKNLNLDAAVSMAFPTIKEELSADVVGLNTDSSFLLGITVGHNYIISDKKRLRSSMNLRSRSVKVTATNGTITENDAQKEFNLSLLSSYLQNINTSTTTFLTTGIILNSAKTVFNDGAATSTETTDKDTQFVIPFIASLEKDLSTRWVLRASASINLIQSHSTSTQIVVLNTSDVTISQVVSDDNSANYGIGFGYKFDDLTLDISVNTLNGGVGSITGIYSF